MGVRIGMLGGTFDPVHNGHLHVAEAVARARGLERVLLVPVAVQPFKQDLRTAGFEDRLAMLRLAVAGRPSLEVELEVDDREGRRGGVSYTVDTARELLAERPGAELSLILGSDNLPLLPRWREAPALLGLACFLVVDRPEEDPARTPEAAAEDWRRFREALAKLDPAVQAAARVERVEIPPCPVSSTEVRRRAAAGEPLDALVPPAVADYIRKHGLYR